MDFRNWKQPARIAWIVFVVAGLGYSCVKAIEDSQGLPGAEYDLPSILLFIVILLVPLVCLAFIVRLVVWVKQRRQRRAHPDPQATRE
jgi:putative copper export protein